MSALLDWLLPRLCLACSATLPGSGGADAAGGGIGLCLRCEERLVRIDRTSCCALCAEAIAGGRICSGCALAPPPWRRLFALWVYAPPLREVVHAFKFRRLDYLGRPLGARLGRWVRERWASPALTEENAAASDRRAPLDPSGPGDPAAPIPYMETPELVIPMPLAWPRRLARGFNQTEILARALAAEVGRPFARSLRRRTAFAHQTGRSRRERLRQAAGAGSAPALADAFRPLPFQRVSGRRLLLVDDVLTTGATARAATAALLAAGALSVDLAVVARTPPGAWKGGRPIRLTPLDGGTILSP
jgi:predicted amidophosphoribosyltransferase